MSRSLRAALRLAAVVPLLAAIAVTAHAQKSKSSAKVSKNQAASQTAKGSAPDSAFLATLKWRFIGPEGNRTDAIAVARQQARERRYEIDQHRSLQALDGAKIH